jgi:hypothetical protein
MLRADLHIHSCLSPCADNGMTPQRIARAAREKGLNLIAVADHNSCENVQAVTAAATEQRLCNLPAMEVTTREEVHVLAIFPRIGSAMAFQDEVYNQLPGDSRPEFWGDQLVVDARDRLLRRCNRLLMGSTLLSLEEAVQRIHALGGLAIAAHVDRTAFGLIGQLGLVPAGVPFDGFECSGSAPPEETRRCSGLPEGAAILVSSDAHCLREVGRRYTLLNVSAVGFEGLRRALTGVRGCGIVAWKNTAG